MRCLNFGSLNLDFTYHLPHIVQPGETIASTNREVFCGGKGLNQSIALAKAGVQVCHAGAVGQDGTMLTDLLWAHGVDTTHVAQLPMQTGHAIIQVDADGQNCIMLYGGSNRALSRELVDKVLTHFGAGDMLVLQNEINEMPYIMTRAYEKGMRIALNPSPFDAQIGACDLRQVSVFMLNEIEGFQISGQKEPDAILDWFEATYPDATVLLTLGEDGARCLTQHQRFAHGIYSLPVVDTTAAGDTFAGYFLSSLMEDGNIPKALELASKASALAISRAGAAPSIPTRDEVLETKFERAL